MSDRDDFVAWTQSRLRDAETALHNGDPGPRLAIWSTREPVSVLGAWQSAVGQEGLRDLFRNLAAPSRTAPRTYTRSLRTWSVTWLSPPGASGHRRRSTASRGGTFSVCRRSTGVRMATGRSPTDTPTRLRTRRKPAASDNACHAGRSRPMSHLRNPPFHIKPLARTRPRRRCARRRARRPPGSARPRPRL
jgi:hypothetical protein